MRLSEMRGVMYQLETIASAKGNFDPIVEFFCGDLRCAIDIDAITNDPEGQLLKSGTIHFPLKEITRWGFTVTYRTNHCDKTIVIQAENAKEALQIFKQHFNYDVVSVVPEV